jgi:hypothetical protein
MLIIMNFVLWRIEPLLGGDSVNNSRCYTVGYVTVEVLLDYNNKNGVFCVSCQ